VTAGDFIIDRYSDPSWPRELMHANLRTAVSSLDWPACKRAAVVTAIPALLQALFDIFGPSFPHDRDALAQHQGQGGWLRPDRGTRGSCSGSGSLLRGEPPRPQLLRGTRRY
jgi:hypothetical protein